jgi:hypothetical protein
MLDRVESNARNDVRPAAVTAALTILYTALAATWLNGAWWVVHDLYDLEQLRAAYESQRLRSYASQVWSREVFVAAVSAGALVSLVLWLWLLTRVQVGRAWAGHILLAWFLAGLLVMFLLTDAGAIARMLRLRPVSTVANLAATAANCAGLALLYLPTSRLWFHRRADARRAARRPRTPAPASADDACVTCGRQIERLRREAHPEARTCGRCLLAQHARA